MTRLGIRIAPRRGASLARRWWWLAGLVGLLALVVAGCSSTNEYPIDFFSEMHYQKSYHSQEPPRLDSPAGAVPYTQGGATVGGAVEPAYATPIASTPVPVAVPDYTLDEMAALTNPLPQDARTVEAGRSLFVVNCVVCHGANADGKGIAAALIFQANNKPLPADLRNRTLLSPKDGSPAQLTDGEYFWVLTRGYSDWMPPFDNLLTPEQRWALVAYIRSIQTNP